MMMMMMMMWQPNQRKKEKTYFCQPLTPSSHISNRDTYILHVPSEVLYIHIYATMPLFSFSHYIAYLCNKVLCIYAYTSV